MLKSFYTKIIFLLAITLPIASDVFASHNMGKDLQYECLGVVGGNVQYRVTVRYYRNCRDGSSTAAAAPSSVTLRIVGSPCGFTQTTSLPRDNSATPPNGSEVSQLCPAELSSSGCNWTGGGLAPYPGVQIYTFSGIVSVPLACSQIIFGTDECCRNSAITNIPNPASNDLSIIAMVNNTVDPNLNCTNNSVTFTNQPVPFFCIGTEATFNHGAVDPEGDSLVYTLVNPMTGTSIPYTNISFNGSFSVTNPISTDPNGFQFDTQTGQMHFTPTLQEQDVLAVRVDEYRNGVWVGSTMRDIQVVTMPCTVTIPYQEPISNVQNGNQVDSLTVQVCPGTPLQFEVLVTDPANHNITLTSNLNTTPSAIPGATMTQVGTGASVIARVNWTPLPSDTGCHNFIITSRNNDCPINGINTRVYSICVFTKVQLLSASPVFCGTPVQLTATGGTNFTWTPSTGPNGVSNPNIYNPTVSPVTDTWYYFESDCGIDSVWVGSVPPFLYDAGQGGQICQNGQVQLNATTDNLYSPYSFRWVPSAGLIDPLTGLPNDTIPNPVASPLVTTNYKLHVTGANGCVNVDSVLVTVNGTGPNIVVQAQPTDVCPKDPVHLNIVANPQSCGITSTACQGNNVRATVGTGTGQTPPGSPTQYPTIYGHYSNSARHQFLYLQSELLALIGSGGSIDSIAFNLAQINTTNDVMQNFEIKMTCTQVTELNAWQNNGLVTVFTPKNVSLGNTPGWIAHKLDFPYDWDGTSNLIVEVCFNNSTNGTLNNKMMMTPTTFNSVYYSRGGTAQCGNTGTPQTSVNRPNTRFSICVTDVSGLPIAWTPSSGINAPVPPDSVSPVAHPEDPTIYHVDVTALNGCVSHDFIYVNVDTAVRFYAFPYDTFFCSPTPLKITTTRAGVPLPGNSFNYEFKNLTTNTVEYTGALDNFTVTPTTTTDYLVTLSGAACTLTDTIHVRIGNNIPLTFVVDSIDCFGAADGKIQVVPIGGTPPITYVWNVGGSTDSLVNLVPGTYSVSMEDSQGCIGNDSVTLTQPPLLTVTSSRQDILCNGMNDGSITLTVNGGVPSYSYAWTPTQPNSPNLTGLAADTYSVVVTDANGCSVTASETITEPTALTVSVITSNATSFGGNDGWAQAVPAGGVSPYTYQWSNGETTQTISNLSANTYCLTVTDANLCSATSCGTVTDPPPITLTFVTTDNLCFGDCNGTASVSATGGIEPYTFVWSNGDTGDSTANLCAGVYTVTATDSAGISVAGNVNITEPTQVTVVLDTTNISCFGANNGSVLATASGGTNPYTYAWNIGGNANPNTSLAPDTYIVTATDANSCTTQATWTATEPPELTVAITDTTHVSCFGGNDGSATAVASGGTPSYSYAWSNLSSITNPISGFLAGNQSVTVTDANSCTASAGFVISEPTELVVAVVSTTNVTCNGGTDGAIDIAVSGGTTTSIYSYSWNNGGGTTEDLNGVGANTYNVTVTDANGCTASTNATVTEPTAITLTFQHDDPLCTGDANGSATVTASGGTPGSSYTYNWAYTLSPNDNATLSNLPSGTYDVTVTDANSCTVAGNVTLTNPITISAGFINKNEITCANAQDGSVEVTASGGTPPLSFLWNNNSTSPIISNLAPGTYVVTVQDVNGCDTSLGVTFIAPPLITIDVITIDSASCPEYTDGSIHVSAIGGTPGALIPYEYSIDGTNFQQSEYLTNLAAGVYHLTIRDGKGCTFDTTVIVGEPLKLQLSVLPQDSSIDLGESITLVSNISGYSGSDINFYSWWPITGLNCGDCASVIAAPYFNTDYTLTVNYLSNCSVSETVRVFVGNGEPFFIPNAFSPNGDGNNDVFTVYGTGLSKVNVKIFNRWGEKVYESSNQWGGWDGTYKGELQNPGVFSYTIEGVYLNGKKVEKSGSFTLIR